ncbi:hypothetical protein P9112_004632 [Eukaryota sp. TZLM1-RC]
MGRQNPAEKRPRKRSNKKTQSSSVVGRSLIKKTFGNARPVLVDPFAQTLSNNERIQAVESGPNQFSVTEVSDLTNLMDVAALSQRNFEAERERNTVLLSTAFSKPPSAEMEFEALLDGHERLTIPRRPEWTPSMSAEQVKLNEQESFLEWRRKLAHLEEVEGLVLTPFERNLDFWRQLWRVVEQSDLVLLIVDARNPFLFRCADLEKFVKDSGAQFLFLANKADLVPVEYRRAWRKYLVNSLGSEVLFFSATHASQNDPLTPFDDVDGFPSVNCNDLYYQDNGGDEVEEEIRVLTVNGVFSLLKSKALSVSDHWKQPVFKVGMLGYPNVGKSSCINALAGKKCVSVAATPGKTKHFQTIPLSEKLHLLDCPGLVFPAALYSKSELAVYGILHADTLRDTVSPASIILDRVDISVINSFYGTSMTTKSPNPHHLLSAIAQQKGLYCGKGQPDVHRVGRLMLKDVFNGRLLVISRPYGTDSEELSPVHECSVGLIGK